MSTKSFIKLLITLILTFGLTAMCILVAYICTSGGSLLGYEFASAEDFTHINTMLLGLDKGGTRTDVMIMAQLNHSDNEINMLQIPRDTYVKDNGRYDRKINSAYGQNKEKTVFKEVKQITGIDVNKYVVVDTTGFKDLIDTIGGVEFDVPQDMNYDDPDQNLHIHLKAGLQHLDGDKAEQLVRFRSYPDGDIGRMKVQSAFIQATVDRLFNLANVFKVSDIVEDFSNIVETNFSLNEMLSYAPYVFATDRDKIRTHQLIGTPQYINGGSYVVPDYDANRKLVDEYFTPSDMSESKSTKELETGVVGIGSVTKSAGDARVKESFLNRFVSVEIIDASDGSSDAYKLREMLKEYGYNARNVSTASKAVFEKTTVVSKTVSSRAATVSKIAGVGQYTYNPVMETSSDITVIIGKDFDN